MACKLAQRSHGSVTWLNPVMKVSILSATIALAAADSAPDCRAELAGQPMKSGTTLIVQVRLMHVPDGKQVTDAAVTTLRFDMGPDGMAAMSAPAKAAVSPRPGIYVFETRPSMPGNWALHLQVARPNHAPVEVALVIPTAK